MQPNRDKPWMCWRCGYAMTANSSVDGKPVAPKEDDISCCLNCGALYTRHGGAWQPMTRQEQSTMTIEEWIEIGRVRASRLGGPDLSKRGGRA